MHIVRNETPAGVIPSQIPVTGGSKLGAVWVAVAFDALADVGVLDYQQHQE